MKNWKTTIAGIFLASVQILSPVISTGIVTIGDVLKGVGLAVLGWIAKDYDQTGK